MLPACVGARPNVKGLSFSPSLQGVHRGGGLWPRLAQSCGALGTAASSPADRLLVRRGDSAGTDPLQAAENFRAPMIVRRFVSLGSEFVSMAAFVVALLSARGLCGHP